MDEMQVLREYVRTVLRSLKKQQKEQLRLETKQERQLRKAVRKMLREKQDTVQHSSTGINALEKLLNSIVPILETGYKDLKTDVAQRTSFRAHIVRAVQNLLSTASVFFTADKKMQAGKNGAEPEIMVTPPEQEAAPEEELTEQEVNVKISDPKADPNFIDIDKDAAADEEETTKDPMTAFETIADEDLTGRNFALETFKKIQKQILETYSLLSNEQDREIFYDYLITNVKLYFDKFETELTPTPEEPTTPEYEAEKSKLDAQLQAAGPETGGEAPEEMAPEGGEELAPELPPA